MINNDLKFFTNEPERDLYTRFSTILQSNTQFFDALVGYFRSSGFFKLYESLETVDKIRILVGLNVDCFTMKIIDQANNDVHYTSVSSIDAKEVLSNKVETEFAESNTSEAVERGVRVFIDWLKSGKLEMRLYAEAPIHAKVYIMRKDPEKVPDTFGSVITGSSNFSEAGLVNNLEFNVELKDYGDVRFALDKFEELWDKSIDISDSWIILPPEAFAIKAKVDNNGTPLKNWNVSINRGIITGFNDAFIITREQKEQIISEDPKSAEIIRPILRGRDIKRYETFFADLWLITTFPSLNYNINDYPAIKKHLLSFGIERLEQTGITHIVNGEPVKARKRTNNKWYETQDSISYWDDFNKQKIVYREISNCMDACIVEPGVFLNNKCYMITGDHLIYLISVMNSTLFNKVILQNANTTGGKGFGFLEKVCIPFPPETVEKQIIELYYSRTPSNSRTVDKKVDSIVYSLYGLADSEIRIVEAM